MLQIENWSSPSSAEPGQKPEVDLLVPPGQLPIGEALIKAMYEKRPDLSALSQQQQLQLLQLADAYAVEKVAFVACSSLSKLTIDAIDWPTAVAFLSLPASCDKLPPCKVLKATAARRLHQQLSDLDVIWTGCEQSQQQQQQQQQQQNQQQQADQKLLLGLPCSALCQLLALDILRVSSEDTVFYTISQWLQANPATTPAEKQQLSQVLRLPHCTPTYLSNVMCSKDSWLRSCFTDEDLFRACGLSSRSGDSGFSMAPCRDNSATSLARNPAWLLSARSISAISKCGINWEVPLADLQAKFEEALTSGAVTSLRSPAKVWQGRAFSLELCFEKAPALRIVPFLIFEGAIDVVVDGSLRVASVRYAGAAVYYMNTCILGGCGKWSSHMFGINPMDKWANVRDELERRGFVCAGDQVQLIATIQRLA